MKISILTSLIICFNIFSLHALQFIGTYETELELYEEDVTLDETLNEYRYLFDFYFGEVPWNINVTIESENVSTTWANLAGMSHFTVDSVMTFTDETLNDTNSIQVFGNVIDPEKPAVSYIVFTPVDRLGILRLTIHWNTKRTKTDWRYGVEWESFWYVDAGTILSGGYHASPITRVIPRATGGPSDQVVYELRRIRMFSQETLDKNWSANMHVSGHSNIGIPETDTLAALDIGDTGYVEINFYLGHYPEVGKYESYGFDTISFEIYDKYDTTENRRVDTLNYLFCWQVWNEDCYILSSSRQVTSKGIQVYPNPATDEFILTIAERFVANRPQVRIYNGQGKVVFNDFVSQANTKIPSDWNSGIYFIELIDQTQVRRLKKLVIAP